MSAKIAESLIFTPPYGPKRQIRITHPEEEERVTLDILWETNRALPGDAVRYEPMQHPPSNARLQELLLELLCAVRRKPYSFDLT
ncbi:hypothetical protein GCM10023213_19970 [Prosthecobacter algae]|uniref:Uncharacterized protein n=1 Tax=Prosthecobacter algae TaxID=1144682 RepID=A0ABP9P255_9BACT